jgi:hypothetical protein
MASMGAGPESTAKGDREPARGLSGWAARPDTLFIGDLRADVAGWQRGEGYCRAPLFQAGFIGSGPALGLQADCNRAFSEAGWGVESELRRVAARSEARNKARSRPQRHRLPPGEFLKVL